MEKYHFNNSENYPQVKVKYQRVKQTLKLQLEDGRESQIEIPTNYYVNELIQQLLKSELAQLYHNYLAIPFSISVYFQKNYHHRNGANDMVRLDTSHPVASYCLFPIVCYFLTRFFFKFPKNFTLLICNPF